MRRFCIIGYPVSHSISPMIYNGYFEEIGYDGSYRMEEVKPDDFENGILRIFENYDGFNITIPHKERMMSYLDEIEEGSGIIGAVNCVVLESGVRKGYNTDWMGFVRSLGRRTRMDPILLLGAGGTARAVLYGLKKMGISRVIILNRTYERALNLKRWAEGFGLDLEVKHFGELRRAVKGVKVLINTTSVGMKGERFDLSEEDLENLDLIYDVIYFETPLQRLGRNAGIEVVDGKEMLYNQAVENLKIWKIPLLERKFREVFDGVIGKMKRERGRDGFQKV